MFPDRESHRSCRKWILYYRQKMSNRNVRLARQPFQARLLRAAGSAAVRPLGARDCCQATSIGAATGDRGIGAYQDADDQRKGERMQHFAAKEEERQHGQEGQP